MDKILIVTGGSRGIGYSTALHFLHKNWKVINISRSSITLDDVINIISKTKGKL
jgi:NAD(P)-dependent dehydrogenase (short-subunit alcohol dehydrogenase family)